MNDLEFFQTMLEEFLENIAIRLDDLSAALAAKDARKLQRTAHNLKGMASNFSAGRLTELARELEHLGAEGDFSQAQELVAAIEGEIPRLRTYLGNLQS